MKKLHIILLLILNLATSSLYSQVDMYVSPNAIVHISQNAIVQVNGSVTIGNNATLSQQSNSALYITNDFQIIGTFTSSNGTTYFIGSNNSTISGSGSATFYKLVLNKDVNVVMLFIDKSITINNDLDITKGWLRILNNAAQTIDLYGNLNLTADGFFDASTTGSANHSLNFYGLFNNNGIIDLNTTGGKITINFLGSTDVNLNGSGSFDFYEVNVNKNNATNYVNFDKSFTAVDNFLTLTQGEFRLTSNYSITNNFFKLSGTDYTIPDSAAFILDNPNVVVSGQTVAGNAILRGKLHIKQGEFNLGTAGESNLVYDRTSGYAELEITGGTMNVRTAIYPNNSSRLLRFSQTNGTLNIGNGSSNSNNQPMFDIPNNNSLFNFTGGTLKIHRGNTNVGVDDYRVLANLDTVTANGTLEINDDVSGQTIEINSTADVGNLLINANNTPSILLKNDLQVIGNVTFNGNGSNIFNTQNYKLQIKGNLTNNFANNNGFNNSTGRVVFNGNTNQDIGGTQSTTFNILQIDKTVGRVELNTNARVNGSIRFISSSILDVNTNKITMAPETRVYSDDGLTYNFDTFNQNKCIVLQNTSQLAGGSLEFELNPSVTLPYEIHYPVTTENVYTPMKIRLLPSGVSYGTNPKITVREYAGEHPQVEAPNVSLKKYWIVKSNDLTINTHGVEVVGIYDNSEVEGNEGSYQVLAFSPNYNDPNGYWRVNPGLTNYVNNNTNLWYSQQTNFLDGDWTVGEQNAGQATYYARANGDYNDPNTWSKIYFNGTASATAPNKRSDRVRIQDHIVTITDSVAAANLISVEVGTEGRANGTLKIEGNHYVKGDTFKLEQNCKLYFAHQQGITISPYQTGAIRTDVRSLSDYGIYVFWQGQNQASGDGIPDLVNSIILDKTSGSTATMSKNIGIRDSLVIINGILDLATSSVNGYTPGRTFKMYDGEMIVRNSYPLNYTPPFLTAGRITFDGPGNATIPSENSTPGVAQYNNLKIAGSSRAGNITFENAGKIRILGDFDISELNFANNTHRFFTSGSTVRFVKNGNQNISFIPNSPTDSVCQLQFYNLELVNPGNKSIVGTSPYPFSINNQLTLDSSVTFVQNNANIEIQSHWTNLNGSVFQPTAGKFVSFFAPTNTIDLNIISRDTTDNDFEDVIIRGPGNVKPQDNLVVKGSLTILSGTNFIVNGVDLFLYKNWSNYGGTFTHTNSTAYFQGNTTQTITKTSGDETFHNLVLRNPTHLNANGIGNTTNGLIINNNLDLVYGRINARDRFVQVGGTITRPGGGYINSALRRNIPAGTTTLQYEVGYQDVYTPITLYFNGSGGTAGLLQVLSDTITTTTSPISWTDATPTDISPLGSQISPEKHIARQWNITKPSGSSFSLGSRKYDAIMHFIGSAPPNGDLRNGMSPFLSDAKIYNGSNWVGPLYYGTYPYVGTQANDSLEFKEIIDLGAIIVGEPSVLTYYTRNSGNWKTASNWSTISYDGPAATSYPGQLGPNFRASIGASHQITLDTNLVVNNTPTNSCIVTVDSSGVLDLGTFTITGTGEFRLFKYGTIRIGHPDGITASSSTGNIRTTTRSYNYNNYNLGTFVYNGSGAQYTGDGLPSGTDSIRVLIINKPSGTVTINAANNLNIKDSLYIQSGTFNSGNRDIYLRGNMRLGATASFQHNNRTFYITGAKGDTLSAESYTNPIVFYNLTISKPSLTGNTVLDNNTIIHINNQLNFTNTNRSIIDAITKSNQTTPNYVRMGTTATVTGAQQFNTSQAGGWIYGRLHKNIPADDAPNVVFEIGDDSYYTPLEIDFRSGTGSAAGYLMAQPEYGFHPKLYNTPQSLYPINPNRVILSRWKLVKPNGSTFVRGTRNFDPTVRFPHPQYTTLLDCVGCADLTYYRGGDSLQWWQTMARNSTYDNSGTQNFCGDTRISPHPTPNFNYNGSTCTSPNQPTSWIRVLDLNTNFGTDEIYANGDTLLAEFVAGNRNSIRYYNFYSIADGDWTDPNTWSTVSFNSNLNEALNDTDPNVYPFPVRQYDNALIGNGKTVRLNSDIGHNDYGSSPQRYTHAGPSVKVYETGAIDFGTRTLRGNGFSLFKGGKIIIGAQTGITTTGTGNIILGLGNTPSFADSSNFVYSAVGQNISNNNWGFLNRNASTHYIESVTIRRTSDNALMMQSVTGSKRTFTSNAHNYIWDKSADLVAGETYYIQINPSNVATNRRYKGWINFNYGNNNFTETGEQIFNVTSSDTINITTSNFTIPATMGPGTTHLRIGMRDNTTNFAPTENNQQGEFEEYTINIINSNTIVAQTVGSGLPTKIASFEVNSPRPTSTVALTKNIEVIDSVKVSSGSLLAGANTIKINGAFIVDTTGGFSPQTSTVEFFGQYRDTIRSKVSNFTIPFYNLTINKAFSDTIIYIPNTNISVSNTFNWNTNNNIVLGDNYSITLQSTSALIGSFSKNRMVRVSGSTNSGQIIRQFTNTGGASNPKTFIFPIGIDTNYYQVYVRDTAATWIGTPEMRVSVVSGQHPQKLNNNILNIYWKTRFLNWNTNLDTLKFTYKPNNVTGDTNKYIPAYWNGNNWQFDLGILPWAKSSPISIKNTINFQATNPSNFAEWTAGQPTAFSNGRKFYSRNYGQWNNPFSWSADTVLKHNGPAASYYPGDLFETDTVHIDGHKITFSLDSCRVDSIRIGGTNSSPTAGVLEFANTSNNKKLITRQLFLDTDNGQVSPINVGINIDTLIISQNILNNSLSPGGFDFVNGTHSIALKFDGSGNSEISGNGVWQDINTVVLNKSGGLADTLSLNSTSFATSSLSFNPNFVPIAGVIKSNSGLDTRIASSTNDLTLQPNSGLHTVNGGLIAERNLIANSNSTIQLDNGVLKIGNATDRNFVYSSGSQITINNAQMSIAGGFLRSVPTSTTTLYLNHPNSALIVGRIGYTGIDPTFDLQNSGSSLTMTNGRIIVVTGNANSTSDINISATGGGGITGGDIQLGDSTIAVSSHPFKFSGSTPIYNMHLVNDAAETVNYISSLTSLEYTVKNNIIVDKKQDLNLNGNTLILQGNLIVYGKVTATPSSPSSLSWRMILNGTNDQYIRNYNSSQPSIEIYSLRIAKNSGNIILGGGGSSYSNLKVNDHLEFVGSNNAFIDSRTNNFEVLVGPNSANLGIYQISRPNLGHISGKLSRYIPNGPQTFDFPIGLDTIGAYRPVQIVTTGTNNTAGYVEAIVYPDNHPDIANSTLLPTTNVPRYWAINPDSDFGAFALGSGGKYQITTTFKNPDDVPNPPSLSLFEHRLYSPSYPASGTWSTPSFLSSNSTSVTSQNLTTWGDFVIGEPNTVTFYSYQSGNWQDINTWSLSGYTIANPPTRIPNQNTDIVRIGNGKTVTLLDDGTYPQVRNVIVEEYNGNPGYLQINGQFNYIRGLIFQLDDGNSLGIQHVDGIRPITDGNVGAIQTNSRNFGISRYIFNSNTGNQITGTGLPNYVKSLIIDNSSPNINKKVFLSNYPGAPQVNVIDSLFVRQGIFNLGNRNLRLLGQFVIDSISNEGKVEPLSSKVILDSNTTKNIVIRNRSGINLFDLQLVDGSITVKREGTKVTNQSHLNIAGTLDFAGPTILVLGDSTNIHITNSDINAITNYSNNRFVQTSRTSGSLIRNFSSTGLPKTYVFPVGSYESGNNYAPAEVTVSSMTTQGKLGIRTSPGDYGGFPGGHARLSTSPSAEYIKRYWTIDSVTSSFTGLVKFYYNQPEVVGYESNYNRLGRWNPVREQSGGVWTQYFNPTIDTVNNFFQTTSGFASADLTGDWTIGNLYAFRRIFFSRQSGNWNDPNSWTYSPTHSGPIFGPGLWPDNTLDSAVIGGGDGGSQQPHEITLNVNANIQGTALGTSATNRGILNTNFNVLTGQYFTMGDYSHLKITSPDGITTVGNSTGNIQTTDIRSYNTNFGIFEYNGNTNQAIGDGLPSTVRDLIINNSGAVNNNIVTLDKNVSIQNNLTITQGALNLNTFTANNSTGSGLFSISANARLIVGGSNNLSLVINNYPTYNIDVDSFIEFNGNLNQQIDLLPPNLTSGLGNVDLTNSGTKIVDNPLLIRGNLTNYAGSTLQINVTNSLEVRKNVINHSAIINSGILEIGD